MSSNLCKFCSVFWEVTEGVRREGVDFSVKSRVINPRLSKARHVKVFFPQ